MDGCNSADEASAEAARASRLFHRPPAVDQYVRSRDEAGKV